MSTLDLSSEEGQNRNKVNTEGYKHIPNFLGHPSCQIHTLILGNTGMGEQGFLYFCRSFRSALNLKFKLINLANNEICISEDHFKEIRSSLSNIYVNCLELQKNLLRETGTRLLGEILGVSYGRSNISMTLSCLDISSNCIKGSGFEKLCSTFPHNKKLEELRINNNNLTELESFYYMKNLVANTWSIKKLEIRKTLMGSANHNSNFVRNFAEGL